MDIRVIGCGGAGSRFLRYLVRSLEFDGISINDANSDIVVDRNNVIAYSSAPKNYIEKQFSWINNIYGELTFVIAGLGGDIGTGLSRMLGKMKKDSLLYGIFTFPFSSENESRLNKARDALKDIEKTFDGYFLIDNDSLVRFYSSVPIKIAMSIPAELAYHIINDFVYLVANKPSFFKNAMGIGVGFGVGRERILISTQEALRSPWLKGNKMAILVSGDIDEEDARIALKHYSFDILKVRKDLSYGDKVKSLIVSVR